MPFVSITRLRVKSVFYLIPFFRANQAATKQLAETPGFVVGKELVDKNFTFWTLTVWNEESNMKAFRNSAAHRKAMQKLPFWCNEASYFHWVQQEADLPTWRDASKRLLQEGKIAKVRKPSANQLNNSFPPIKWSKLETTFKPSTQA